MTFKFWIYVLKSQIPKNMRKNVFAFTEMIPNIFDTCVIKSRKVKKELCTKEKYIP